MSKQNCNNLIGVYLISKSIYIRTYTDMQNLNCGLEPPPGLTSFNLPAFD
ncbi:hypothetical protein [Sporisorium scitamineum]|uniref:Uncharacterized protein n=1 Tax=Sporisorium scitamineum TaxID=49012 RepID=A0A0F7RVX2_9BASI|nr:hypothetical protein [Sporisorium scitamineum]